MLIKIVRNLKTVDQILLQFYPLMYRYFYVSFMSISLTQCAGLWSHV